MTVDTVRFAGLSCYTANLAGYLAAEWDADALLAASVRLAVRVDLPGGTLAFAHHGTPLDRLPDGTRLCHTTAADPAAALPRIERELARRGRVLVTVDAAGLPWSPGFGADHAPHWLLIDGRAGADWHVVDEFHGLLPAGTQLPYAGWLPAAQVTAAMVPPPSWTPEQWIREEYAFGASRPVPAAGALRWLRREPGTTPGAASGARPALPGRWLTDDGDVLPFLAEHLTAAGAAAGRHLDDCWAAAGHRSFAHRWRLARCRPDGSGEEAAALQAAIGQWDLLPRTLRYAVESAQRGRPRPSLVRTAFAELLLAEAAVHQAAENRAAENRAAVHRHHPETSQETT